MWNKDQSGEVIIQGGFLKEEDPWLSLEGSIISYQDF